MAQNEKKTLLTVGAVSLVLAGGAAFGIYYTFGKVEEEKGRIESVKAEIATATKKINKIKQLENDVIILRENVEEYAKILPDEREVTDYARTLAGYCSKAGVALTDLSPDNRTKSGGKDFVSIRYKMKLSGSFWQIMRLINYLENHPRFMEVKTIDLEGGEEKGNSPFITHQAKLVVETYTYKGKKSEKSVKIPQYEKKKTFLETDIQKKRVKFDRTRYRFKGKAGRRDIFADPRFNRDVHGGGGLTQEQQQRIIEQGRQALTELVKIKKAYEAEDNIIVKNQRNAQYRQGHETLAQFIKGKGTEVSYPPLRSQLQKYVLKPFEDLPPALGQEDRVRTVSLMSIDDLERIQETMAEMLERGELEDAERVFKGAENELVKIVKSKRAVTRQLQLVKEIRRLKYRAKVAREFGTIKLDISGKIIRENALSLVIINNEPYLEGDAYRNNDDLFIKGVASDHVVFIYKGVLLKKYQ